ncbi:MAG: serine/threonine-protein kinase [Solirubrobacteraceae bacterium]
MVATGSLIAPGYRVIEHLARTRRLDTFEVWSEERACSCVAKALRPDRREDERARAALEHEGRLLLALTHPHIVRGYELLTEPELTVVMETLDGETVAHLVDRHPDGLPPEEVAWLGIHLASALRYLHGRGLLHLDVKPSNVVADGGRAKLIDLSLARPPGRYRPGVGTWCNLSPEQAAGGELGPPADVWGLGTVLYEAATGEAAFDDDGSWTDDSGPSGTWDTDDQREAGYPQLVGAAPSAAANGRLPPALVEAIDACLEPAPADRPALEDLAAQLQRFAA